MNTAVPFEGCWWATYSLLAGPAFFSGDLTPDVRKLALLEKAGISTIISLVGLDDYYSDENEAEVLAWAIVPRFVWLGFGIPNGTAPNKETMKIMLQWIDVGLGKMEGISSLPQRPWQKWDDCWLLASSTRHCSWRSSARLHRGTPRSFWTFASVPRNPEQRGMVIHWPLHG